MCDCFLITGIGGKVTQCSCWHEWPYACFGDQITGWFLWCVTPVRMQYLRRAGGEEGIIKNTVSPPKMSKDKDKILSSSHYGSLLQGCLMTLSCLSFRTMMAAFWIFYLNIYKLCQLPKWWKKLFPVSFTEIVTHVKMTRLMKNKPYLIFRQTWHMCEYNAIWSTH